MKKFVEAEHQLKLAIRDIVVRNPLVSVHQLRRDLAERGFKTANGIPSIGITARRYFAS
jgi:hypothetical protein